MEIYLIREICLERESERGEEREEIKPQGHGVSQREGGFSRIL